MVRLYVEGGGETAALRAACREGFTTFITRAGIKHRPRIVACGTRRNAYDSFCTAIASGEDAMLMVDSEDPVGAHYHKGTPDKWRPWAHLRCRIGDKWDKPTHALDTQCHLMVQVMENWFLADRDAIKKFFGQGFKENAFPPIAGSVEGISKQEVYDALARATRGCKTKASYSKGEHSFKLLASIDVSKVAQVSPWAKRFVDELRKKMDA